MDKKAIVIVGGGIAGVTCLETLVECYARTSRYSSITLISESRIVKKVVNYTTHGRNLEHFDVLSTDVSSLSEAIVPEGLEFHFVVGTVTRIDSEKRTVHIDTYTDGIKDNTGREIFFDLLCLCQGSRPRRLIPSNLTQKEVFDRVVVLRDTTSLEELKQRLADSKKIAIVGNGGISLELVQKFTNCHISWLIRDEYVGHPFLDPGASKFILDAFNKAHTKTETPSSSSANYITSEGGPRSVHGPALGPFWSQNISLAGAGPEGKKLYIFRKCQVEDIVQSGSVQHSLRVYARGADPIDCDLVVSAIGVDPSTINFTNEAPELSTTDGGILVDEEMRTTVRGIYAAGDVASCDKWTGKKLWFQMRLWTQARQMGFYCGKCISAHLADEDPSIYANFDCFTHVTSFLGYKIVLLGRYRRDLDDPSDQSLEVFARVTRDKDYIKLLLEDNRIIGAILVGETNLEETIENLIHDCMDVCDIKDNLLDGTVDIEDYFD